MQDHWQSVYASKGEQQTSWYRPRLDASLALVDGLDLVPTAPLVDVGGGRSTLAGDLLARGFRDVTVLDLSEAALSQARAALGAAGDGVRWIAGDVLDAALPLAHYALWHDRAVFHFLVDEHQRRRYVAQAVRSVRPGGWLLVATFAADGPEQCSGLPVRRYHGAELAAEFCSGFEPVSGHEERHETPFGTVQPFNYQLMRRVGDARG